MKEKNGCKSNVIYECSLTLKEQSSCRFFGKPKAGKKNCLYYKHGHIPCSKTFRGACSCYSAQEALKIVTKKKKEEDIVYKKTEEYSVKKELLPVERRANLIARRNNISEQIQRVNELIIKMIGIDSYVSVNDEICERNRLLSTYSNLERRLNPPEGIDKIIKMKEED